MPNPNPTGGRIVSIGAVRHASGWPWASIAGPGGRVVYGSDCPVAGLDPAATFYVPLTRSAQRLSTRAVIDAYTKTPAYASFDDERLGAIETGKIADLVVLSKDVFAEPPTTADAVNVAATVFDGKVVYSRNR
jgi:predicted amidohydrolase YtcJ